MHLDVSIALQLRFGKKIFHREIDNVMIWGYLSGIRDAILTNDEKNERYVNVVITPTIVLPPSQQPESKKAAKPATKSASNTSKKKLVKAREYARANVECNVKDRLRQFKKKDYK